MNRPLLAVDVDGVISLFGFDEPPPAASARFELVDGMVHCISLGAGERLLRLGEHFDMVWATGWEEKANDYLPNILGLPELPVLTFERRRPLRLGPLEAGAARRVRQAAGRWPGSTTASTRAVTSGPQSRDGADAARPDRVRPRPRGGPHRSADRLGARASAEPRARLSRVDGFLADLLPARRAQDPGPRRPLAGLVGEPGTGGRRRRGGLRRRPQALEPWPARPRGPHSRPYGGAARRRIRTRPAELVSDRRERVPLDGCGSAAPAPVRPAERERLRSRRISRRYGWKSTSIV